MDLLSDVLDNSTLTEELNRNFDKLAPMIFGYRSKSQTEAKKITNSFKEFYFKNQPITKDSLPELAQVKKN